MQKRKFGNRINAWAHTTCSPYAYSEYLPTHNPNEWIAKAGSAAEGKMDLLSVM